MRIDRVKLIAEMARQEITVKELSKKSSVCYCTLCGVRNGRSCSTPTAIKIARALGVNLCDLVNLEGES